MSENIKPRMLHNIHSIKCPFCNQEKLVIGLTSKGALMLYCSCGQIGEKLSNLSPSEATWKLLLKDITHEQLVKLRGFLEHRHKIEYHDYIINVFGENRYIYIKEYFLNKEMEFLQDWSILYDYDMNKLQEELSRLKSAYMDSFNDNIKAFNSAKDTLLMNLKSRSGLDWKI